MTKGQQNRPLVFQFQFNDIIDANYEYRNDYYYSQAASAIGQKGTNYKLNISGSYYFWYTENGGISY